MRQEVTSGQNDEFLEISTEYSRIISVALSAMEIPSCFLELYYISLPHLWLFSALSAVNLDKIAISPNGVK